MSRASTRKSGDVLVQARTKLIVSADELNADSTALSDVDHVRQHRMASPYSRSRKLEIDDAPYRDIGRPLRAYLRSLTDDGRTEVVVVMPELVVRGLSRVLHNQRALYLKRLLLFEPRVILASVPYQLMR